MTTLDTALHLHNLGLPLVIVHADSKAPTDTAWQHATYTADQIRSRYTTHPALNIGLALGPGSYIDVECDSPEAPAALGAMFGGAIPDTPTWDSTRGSHRLFRWDDRLAGLPAKVMLDGVEFRLGPGAQSVLPPSTADGVTRRWTLPLTTPVASLPDSVIERLVSLGAAAKEHKRATAKQQINLDPRKPGDDYCLRADWASILAGWAHVGSTGDTDYWRRPGKTDGISATTGHCTSEAGRDLLYIFTTNALPFEGGKTYSKFAAYTLLNHDGDFRAAAAALADEGYGARDLRSACRSVGGVWTGRSATCHTYDQARQLAAVFSFALPELPERPITFRYQDASTIVAEASRKGDETFPGWGIGYRKLMLAFPCEAPPEQDHDYDALARHVITTAREDAGWLMRDEANRWIYEPQSTVKSRLQAKLGLTKEQAAHAIGTVAGSPYILVNEPFEPEFLDGRRWNKFGAQLAVAPTYGGQHPHADMVLAHLGRSLDAAVAADLDCRERGIVDGRHYISLWCALLFQRPKQHLPMLYLFSPDHDAAGKSTLAKMLALLFARGCVDGTRMLRDQFNAELGGARLCYLDEERIDHKQSQKIKRYIDSDEVSIRAMRTNAYMMANYSAWIAAFNFVDGIGIDAGDQRIVMFEVANIADENKLDWSTTLRPALEAEASELLGTLLTMELPKPCGRLYLPVLSTPLKDQVTQTDDLLTLERKIIDGVKHCPAFVGSAAELCERFSLGNMPQARKRLHRLAPALKVKGINITFPGTRKIIIEVTQ